tara:strand:- start:630 stop:773 length:144 start_codon:yes stop_codon:yes gene_type:complete
MLSLFALHFSAILANTKSALRLYSSFLIPHYPLAADTQNLFLKSALQ